MKFNLKNRPTKSQMALQSWGEHFVDTENWFEGFEKELREILTTEYVMPDGSKGCMELVSIFEILGEDSS